MFKFIIEYRGLKDFGPFPIVHYLAPALSSMSHLICDSYLVLVVSTTYGNTFIQVNDLNVY